MSKSNYRKKPWFCQRCRNHTKGKVCHNCGNKVKPK